MQKLAQIKRNISFHNIRRMTKEIPDQFLDASGNYPRKKEQRKNQLPSVIQMLKSHSLNIAELRQKLDRSVQIREVEVRKPSKYNSFFTAIGARLYDDCLADSMLSVYFERIPNKENYLNRLSEYIAVLFCSSFIFEGQEIAQRHKCVGIKSEAYSIFKIILFKIINNWQEQVIPTETFFEGCKIIERYRLYITTTNQMYTVYSKDKIIVDLIRQLHCAQNIRFCKLIQNMVQFLFNCSGLDQLNDNLVKMPLLGMNTFLTIKKKVLDICYKHNVDNYIMMQAVENFRFIKSMMVRKVTLQDYVKKEFGEDLDCFIKKVSSSILPLCKKDINKKKAVKLICLNIFQKKKYAFSLKEVIKILKSMIDKEFLKEIFSAITVVLKKYKLPHYFYNEIIYDIRIMRKIIMEEGNDDQQLRSDLQKCINQGLVMYKLENQKINMCSTFSMALLSMQEQVYSIDQIKDIHSNIKITKQQYEYLREMVLRDANNQAAIRLHHLFNKYITPVIAR